jgi:hypothetical protein
VSRTVTLFASRAILFCQLCSESVMLSRTRGSREPSALYFGLLLGREFMRCGIFVTNRPSAVSNNRAENAHFVRSAHADATEIESIA